MVRPSQLTPMQRLLLAISLPITLVFLYFLFRKNDDEDDEEADAQVVTSRQTVIEVKVPHDAVGAVIGVQGAQIKMIRNVTKARLNFKDKDADTNKDSILVIQGTQEGAQKAELMVRQIIVDQPQIVTEVIHVPNAAVGRIIGRSGDTIRSISHQSKAKVTVERIEQHNVSDVTQIMLKGTPLAVETAKMLISEKVEDQKAYQKMSAGKFKQTGPAKDSSRMRSEGDGSFTEAYISAVEHPGHFWVQFLDRNALRLSQLVDEMTIYYGSLGETHNKDFEPVVGDIVAAPFSDDNAWYRAQIVGVLGDDVDLYFVDYGDSLVISKERIRRLRIDFRELPFQAKECSLANVEPCSGDVWSEEAIVAFEDLVHVAKWKVLMTRNVGLTATAIPLLQLIDTNGETDVDIAEELVRRGLAVRTSSKTHSSSLPSADKVTASISTSKDLDPRLGETQMQLTETNVLHEPGGSSVTLADRCAVTETSLSPTTFDTGYFSTDLNHLPSYVTGPYESVCDHVNGNSYYNDDDDDGDIGTEDAVVSVQKNFSLGFSPTEQTSTHESYTIHPVVEASQLEVSLSGHGKGIELLETKDVSSVGKVESLEYATIPLQNNTTCETDLRSTEARDSRLMVRSVEALDVDSSAAEAMPDVISVAPETKILMPLQEAGVVPSTTLNFFPSSESGELLAETKIHSPDGIEMDTGTKPLPASAEVPSGNTVDILPLHSLETASTDIPTESTLPVSNSVPELAGSPEVDSNLLFHLSESYPSIKNSLHLSKLRTDLNMSSSEAVKAHQSCLTEGRPVALKQLALVKLANEYLTIREVLELNKHSVETDSNLAETKQDEIFNSLHEAISQTDTSRLQQFEDLSKSYPSVQNSLFLSDQRKGLSQEFQPDDLEKSEGGAVIHSKICVEYPSVRECLALSGSKPERFLESGNLVDAFQQQKWVVDNIDSVLEMPESIAEDNVKVTQSYSDMSSFISLSKGTNAKLETDQVPQKAEEVLKSPTEFAYHEIVGIQSGSVLTTMPEWKDRIGSRQSEKESIVRQRESEIQQESIVSQKEPEIQQESIVSQREPEIQQESIVCQREPEIQQESIVSQREPEIQQEFIVYQREPEIQQESIVSQREPEIQQESIVCQREPEIQQESIVSQREPEIQQESIVSQRLPEIQQESIVSQREPEIQQESIVSQREPEIQQESIVCQREPEIQQESIVCQREPEIQQESIVCQREPEIQQESIVCQREPEIQQESIVSQRVPEIQQESIVCQREPEIQQESIVSQREPEIQQESIVSQRVPEIQQEFIVSQREPEIQQESSVVEKEPETELERLTVTEKSEKQLVRQNDLSVDMKEIYKCEIDNVSHYFPAFCTLSDYESGKIHLKPSVTCRPEWSTDDFDGLVSYIQGGQEKQQSVKQHVYTKPADHHKKHDHISKQEPLKLREHETKEGKAVVLPPNLAAQAFKAGLLDLQSATDEEVSEDHSASRGEDSDDGGFIVVESRKRRRLRSRCSTEKSEETNEAQSLVEHQESLNAQGHYEAVLEKDALDQSEAGTLPMETTMQLKEPSVVDQLALSFDTNLEAELPQSQESVAGKESVTEHQYTEVIAKEEEITIPEAELQKFAGKPTEVDVQAQDTVLVQQLAAELNDTVPFKKEFETFSTLCNQERTLEPQETLSVWDATTEQEAISLQNELDVEPDDSLPIQESEPELWETKPLDKEMHIETSETIPALRILSAQSLDTILVKKKLDEPQIDKEVFIEPEKKIVPEKLAIKCQEVITAQKQLAELHETIAVEEEIKSDKSAEKESPAETQFTLSTSEGNVSAQMVLKAETSMTVSEKELDMEKNLAPFKTQPETETEQITSSINNETYLPDSQKLIYFPALEKLGDFEAGNLQLEPQMKCRPEWSTNDYDALVSYIGGDQADEQSHKHHAPGEAHDHAKMHERSKLHDSLKQQESAHKENKCAVLPPNLAATVFKQHHLEFELDLEKDLPKSKEEVDDDGFKVVESRKRRRLHSRSSVENVDSEGDDKEQSSEEHKDLPHITQEICETEPQVEQEAANFEKECDTNNLIIQMQTGEQDEQESYLLRDVPETVEQESVLTSRELGAENLPFAVIQKETELEKQKPAVTEALQEFQLSASSEERRPTEDSQILSGIMETEIHVTSDKMYRSEIDNLCYHFPALCRLSDYESGKIQLKSPVKYRPEWATNDVESLVSFIDGDHKRQQEQLHSHPKSPERAKTHQHSKGKEHSKAHDRSKAHEPATEGSKSVTLPPNLAAKAFKAGLLDIDTDLDREECAGEEEEDSFTVVETRKHKRQRNRHSVEKEEFEEGNQEPECEAHEAVLSGSEPEVRLEEPVEPVEPVVTEHETCEAVLSGNEPEVRPEGPVEPVISELEIHEAVLAGNEPGVRPEEPVEPVTTELEIHGAVPSGNEPEVRPEGPVEPVISELEIHEAVLAGNEPGVRPEEPVEPVTTELEIHGAVPSGNEPEVRPEGPVEPVISELEIHEAVLAGNEPGVRPEGLVEPAVTEHETCEAVLSGNEPEVRPEEPVEPAVTEHETREAVLSGNEPEVRPEEPVEPAVTEHETREAVLSGNEPDVRPEEPVEPVVSELEIHEVVLAGNELDVRPEEPVEPAVTEHETREAVLSGNEPEVRPEEPVEPVISELEIHEAVLAGNEPGVRPEGLVEPAVTEHETCEAVLSGNEPEVRPEEPVEPVVSELEILEAVLAGNEPDVRPEGAVEPVVSELKIHEAVLSGNEPDVRPEGAVEPVATECETKWVELAIGEPNYDDQYSLAFEEEHETKQLEQSLSLKESEGTIQADVTEEQQVLPQEKEPSLSQTETKTEQKEVIDGQSVHNVVQDELIISKETNEEQQKVAVSKHEVLTETESGNLQELHTVPEPDDQTFVIRGQRDISDLELAVIHFPALCKLGDYEMGIVQLNPPPAKYRPEWATDDVDALVSYIEGDHRDPLEGHVHPKSHEHTKSHQHSKAHGHSRSHEPSTGHDPATESNKIVALPPNLAAAAFKLGLLDIDADLDEEGCVHEEGGEMDDSFTVVESRKHRRQRNRHSVEKEEFEEGNREVTSQEHSELLHAQEHYELQQAKELGWDDAEVKDQKHLDAEKEPEICEQWVPVAEKESHLYQQEALTVQHEANASLRALGIEQEVIASQNIEALREQGFDVLKKDSEDQEPVFEQYIEKQEPQYEQVESGGIRTDFNVDLETRASQVMPTDNQEEAAMQIGMVECRKEYESIVTEKANGVDLDEITCQKVLEVEQQVPDVVPEQLTEEKLLHTMSLSEQQESFLKVAQTEQHEVTNVETVEPKELMACQEESEKAVVQLLPLESISDLHEQQESTVDLKESVNQVDEHVGQKETTTNLIAEYQSDLDTVSHHYAALCKLSGYESGKVLVSPHLECHPVRSTNDELEKPVVSQEELHFGPEEQAVSPKKQPVDEKEQIESSKELVDSQDLVTCDEMTYQMEVGIDHVEMICNQRKQKTLTLEQGLILQAVGSRKQDSAQVDHVELILGLKKSQSMTLEKDDNLQETEIYEQESLQTDLVDKIVSQKKPDILAIERDVSLQASPIAELNISEKEINIEQQETNTNLQANTTVNVNTVTYCQSDCDKVSHHFDALCRLDDYESGKIQIEPPVKYRSEWTTNDVDSLVSYIEGDHKDHLEGHVHPKSHEHTKSHQHSKAHGHSRAPEPSKAHEPATEGSKVVALPPNLAARAFKAGLLDIDTDLDREEFAGEEEEDSFTVVETRKHKRQRNRHSIEKEEFEEGNREVALLEHQESLLAQEHYDTLVAKSNNWEEAEIEDQQPLVPGMESKLEDKKPAITTIEPEILPLDLITLKKADHEVEEPQSAQREFDFNDIKSTVSEADPEIQQTEGIKETDFHQLGKQFVYLQETQHQQDELHGQFKVEEEAIIVSQKKSELEQEGITVDQNKPEPEQQEPATIQNEIEATEKERYLRDAYANLEEHYPQQETQTEQYDQKLCQQECTIELSETLSSQRLPDDNLEETNELKEIEIEQHENYICQEEVNTELEEFSINEKVTEVEDHVHIEEKHEIKLKEADFDKEQDTELIANTVVGEKEQKRGLAEEAVFGEKVTEWIQETVHVEKEERSEQIEEAILDENDQEIEVIEEVTVDENDQEIEVIEEATDERESEIELIHQLIGGENEPAVELVEELCVDEIEGIAILKEPAVGETVSEIEMKAEPDTSPKELEDFGKSIISKPNEVHDLDLLKEPDVDLTKPNIEAKGEIDLSQEEFERSLTSNLSKVYHSDVDKVSHHFDALCRLDDYESGKIQIEPPVKYRSEWATNDVDSLVSYIEGDHKDHLEGDAHPKSPDRVKPHQHSKGKEHSKAHDRSKAHEPATEGSKSVTLPPSLAAKAFKAGLLDIDTDLDREECVGEEEEDSFTVVETRKHKRQRNRHSIEREEFEEGNREVALLEHQESLSAQEHYDTLLARSHGWEESHLEDERLVAAQSEQESEQHKPVSVQSSENVSFIPARVEENEVSTFCEPAEPEQEQPETNKEEIVSTKELLEGFYNQETKFECPDHTISEKEISEELEDIIACNKELQLEQQVVMLEKQECNAEQSSQKEPSFEEHEHLYGHKNEVELPVEKETIIIGIQEVDVEQQITRDELKGPEVGESIEQKDFRAGLDELISSKVDEHDLYPQSHKEFDVNSVKDRGEQEEVTEHVDVVTGKDRCEQEEFTEHVDIDAVKDRVEQEEVVELVDIDTVKDRSEQEEVIEQEKVTEHVDDISTVKDRGELKEVTEQEEVTEHVDINTVKDVSEQEEVVEHVDIDIVTDRSEQKEFTEHITADIVDTTEQSECRTEFQKHLVSHVDLGATPVCKKETEVETFEKMAEVLQKHCEAEAVMNYSEPGEPVSEQQQLFVVGSVLKAEVAESGDKPEHFVVKNGVLLQDAKVECTDELDDLDFLMSSTDRVIERIPKISKKTIAINEDVSVSCSFSSRLEHGFESVDVTTEKKIPVPVVAEDDHKIGKEIEAVEEVVGVLGLSAERSVGEDVQRLDSFMKLACESEPLVDKVAEESTEHDESLKVKESMTETEHDSEVVSSVTQFDLQKNKKVTERTTWICEGEENMARDVEPVHASKAARTKKNSDIDVLVTDTDVLEANILQATAETEEQSTAHVADLERHQMNVLFCAQQYEGRFQQEAAEFSSDASVDVCIPDVDNEANEVGRMSLVNKELDDVALPIDKLAVEHIKDSVNFEAYTGVELSQESGELDQEFYVEQDSEASVQPTVGPLDTLLLREYAGHPWSSNIDATTKESPPILGIVEPESPLFPPLSTATELSPSSSEKASFIDEPNAAVVIGSGKSKKKKKQNKSEANKKDSKSTDEGFRSSSMKDPLVEQPHGVGEDVQRLDSFMKLASESEPLVDKVAEKGIEHDESLKVKESMTETEHDSEVVSLVTQFDLQRNKKVTERTTWICEGEENMARDVEPVHASKAARTKKNSDIDVLVTDTAVLEANILQATAETEEQSTAHVADLERQQMNMLFSAQQYEGRFQQEAAEFSSDASVDICIPDVDNEANEVGRMSLVNKELDDVALPIDKLAVEHIKDSVNFEAYTGVDLSQESGELDQEFYVEQDSEASVQPTVGPLDTLLLREYAGHPWSSNIDATTKESPPILGIVEPESPLFPPLSTATELSPSSSEKASFIDEPNAAVVTGSGKSKKKKKKQNKSEGPKEGSKRTDEGFRSSSMKDPLVEQPHGVGEDVQRLDSFMKLASESEPLVDKVAEKGIEHDESLKVKESMTETEHDSEVLSSVTQFDLQRNKKVTERTTWICEGEENMARDVEPVHASKAARTKKNSDIDVLVTDTAILEANILQATAETEEQSTAHVADLERHQMNVLFSTQEYEGRFQQEAAEFRSDASVDICIPDVDNEANEVGRMSLVNKELDDVALPIDKLAVEHLKDSVNFEAYTGVDLSQESGELEQFLDQEFYVEQDSETSVQPTVGPLDTLLLREYAGHPWSSNIDATTKESPPILGIVEPESPLFPPLSTATELSPSSSEKASFIDEPNAAVVIGSGKSKKKKKQNKSEANKKDSKSTDEGFRGTKEPLEEQPHGLLKVQQIFVETNEKPALLENEKSALVENKKSARADELVPDDKENVPDVSHVSEESKKKKKKKKKKKTSSELLGATDEIVHECTDEVEVSASEYSLVTSGEMTNEVNEPCPESELGGKANSSEVSSPVILPANGKLPQETRHIPGSSSSALDQVQPGTGAGKSKKKKKKTSTSSETPSPTLVEKKIEGKTLSHPEVTDLLYPDKTECTEMFVEAEETPASQGMLDLNVSSDSSFVTKKGKRKRKKAVKSGFENTGVQIEPNVQMKHSVMEATSFDSIAFVESKQEEAFDKDAGVVEGGSESERWTATNLDMKMSREKLDSQVSEEKFDLRACDASELHITDKDLSEQVETADSVGDGLYDSVDEHAILQTRSIDEEFQKESSVESSSGRLRSSEESKRARRRRKRQRRRLRDRGLLSSGDLLTPSSAGCEKSISETLQSVVKPICPVMSSTHYSSTAVNFDETSKTTVATRGKKKRKKTKSSVQKAADSEMEQSIQQAEMPDIEMEALPHDRESSSVFSSKKHESDTRKGFTGSSESKKKKKKAKSALTQTSVGATVTAESGVSSDQPQKVVQVKQQDIEFPVISESGGSSKKLQTGSELPTLSKRTDETSEFYRLSGQQKSKGKPRKRAEPATMIEKVQTEKATVSPEPQLFVEKERSPSETKQCGGNFKKDSAKSCLLTSKNNVAADEIHTSETSVEVFPGPDAVENACDRKDEVKGVSELEEEAHKKSETTDSHVAMQTKTKKKKKKKVTSPSAVPEPMLPLESQDASKGQLLMEDLNTSGHDINLCSISSPLAGIVPEAEDKKKKKKKKKASVEAASPGAHEQAKTTANQDVPVSSASLDDTEPPKKPSQTAFLKTENIPSLALDLLNAKDGVKESSKKKKKAKVATPVQTTEEQQVVTDRHAYSSEDSKSFEGNASKVDTCLHQDGRLFQIPTLPLTSLDMMGSSVANNELSADSSCPSVSNTQAQTEPDKSGEKLKLSEQTRTRDAKRKVRTQDRDKVTESSKKAEQHGQSIEETKTMIAVSTTTAPCTKKHPIQTSTTHDLNETPSEVCLSAVEHRNAAIPLPAGPSLSHTDEGIKSSQQEVTDQGSWESYESRSMFSQLDLDPTSLDVLCCDKSLRSQELRQEMESPDLDFELLPSAADLRAEAGTSNQGLEGVGASSIQQSKVSFHEPNITHEDTDNMSKSWQTVQLPSVSHLTSSSSSADAEVEQILHGQPVSDVAGSDISTTKKFIGTDLMVSDLESSTGVVVTVTEVLDLEFIEETETVTVIESVSDPGPPPSETWAFGRPKMSTRISPVAGKLSEDSEDGKFLTGILGSGTKNWTQTQPDVAVAPDTSTAGRPLASESSKDTDLEKRDEEKYAGSADSSTNVFTLSSALSDIPAKPIDVPAFDGSSTSSHSVDLSLSSEASFQTISDRFVLTEEESSLMTDSCRQLFDQTTVNTDSSKRDNNGFEACQFWISEEGDATSASTWPSVMYSFDKPDASDSTCSVKGTYSTPASSSEVDGGPDRVSAKSSGTNLDLYDDSLDEELTLKVAEFQSDEGSGGEFPVAVGGQPKSSVLSGETWDSLSNDSLEGPAVSVATTAVTSQPESSLGNISEDSLVEGSGASLHGQPDPSSVDSHQEHFFHASAKQRVSDSEGVEKERHESDLGSNIDPEETTEGSNANTPASDPKHTSDGSSKKSKRKKKLVRKVQQTGATSAQESDEDGGPQTGL